VSKQKVYALATTFFLSLACGAVIGDQGDLAVLAFSAAMLASLGWWNEQR